jgi:TatD DNase family protein
MVLDLSTINFIDIHTHRTSYANDTLCLQSVFATDLMDVQSEFFSAGIHPWQVQDDYKAQWKTAEQLFDKKMPPAVGEIGLDKIKNAERFANQKALFVEQMKYAQKHHRPVVIHCVKAFSELLHLLKTYRFTVPIILHAFNANKQTVEQLAKYPVYFSFGSALLYPDSKACSVFNKLPPEQIFFETDEADFPVSDIYKRAEKLSAKNSDFWKSVVKHNFRKVFSNVFNFL